MALKIRLRRHGKKNSPFYRIVVTDSRDRRDGKYVESVGWYDPCEPEGDKHLLIKSDRVQHWLACGACLSENVETLVSKTAPAIIKEYKQKILERNLKITAKKRENRRKKAAAAK